MFKGEKSSWTQKFQLRYSRTRTVWIEELQAVRETLSEKWSLKDIRPWYLHLVNVTLFGKRIFVEVIKERILRWDHPGSSRLTLNADHGGRDRREAAHAKECLQPPEAGRGRKNPVRPQREGSRVDTLTSPGDSDLRLLAPKLGENQCLLA